MTPGYTPPSPTSASRHSARGRLEDARPAQPVRP